jgi:hypothetical protein
MSARKAVVDGHLSKRAVAVACSICGAAEGDRCYVDLAARPYPSTMKIGFADPFHVARVPDDHTSRENA